MSAIQSTAHTTPSNPVTTRHLTLQRQVSLGECGGTGETVAGPNGSARDSHEETQAWTPAKFVV
jgi:hypothetical protein